MIFVVKTQAFWRSINGDISIFTEPEQVNSCPNYIFHFSITSSPSQMETILCNQSANISWAPDGMLLPLPQ